MKAKIRDSEFVSYLLVTVGTFFMAAATNVIYEPLSMVTGGFSGVGIILKKVFEQAADVSIPIWLTTTLLNIPLFLIAMKIRGAKFIRKTLYAAACFSVALLVVPTFEVTNEDYLMAAVLGGVLNGTGIGLVFSQNASTGGSDLMSSLLNRWFPGFSISELLIDRKGVV